MRYVTVSATESMSLTTSYVGSALTTSSVLEGSNAVPDNCEVSLAQLRLASIAGGAAQVTWYLGSENGEHAITAERTDDILDADADNNGSVARLVAAAYNADVLGSLYLWAKLDAGTATGIGVVTVNR